jgi:hypothetical protein
MPASVFDTGADWIFCWPEKKKLLLVWAAVSACESGAKVETERLSTCLEEMCEATSWSWWGGIFLAEPNTDTEETEWVDDRRRVTLLRVPERVHRRWEDLLAGFELTLEALHSA